MSDQTFADMAPPEVPLQLLQCMQMGYSVRRAFVDAFFIRQVVRFAAGSRVLDLGGTRRQKRGQFDIERYDLAVTYANLSAEKQPDVLLDAARIAAADACFDVVICAELLEHVLDPRPVLEEAYRVLRPGGKLLITVPFLYRIHGDPYDFGRYTDHYWHYNLTTLGFAIEVLERQGLFYAVLADFARQYLGEVGKRRLFGRLSRWLGARLTVWALQREQDTVVQTHPLLSSYTTGFGIVAVK